VVFGGGGRSFGVRLFGFGVGVGVGAAYESEIALMNRAAPRTKVIAFKFIRGVFMMVG
jgi:hypothetical protein